MSYFDKFKTIPYAGKFALNLLARVQFTKSTRNNKTIFYPYRMKEEDGRVDVIADKYYGDSFQDWIILLANQVIDPYYELGLPADAFNDFIIGKYGSIANAQSRIAFWRNDWESDDSVISESSYNALLPILKKYWNEDIDYQGSTIGYSRKQEDWIVDTNKLMIVEHSSTAVPQTDDIIHQSGSIAHVSFANSSTMTLKHVQGTISTGSFTFNTDSGTISSILNTVYSIDPSESLYWSPVTLYEYEQEQNQIKRHIRILDKRLTAETEREIQRLL